MDDTIRVKVILAFSAMLDGQFRVVEVDEVVDLPRKLALDMLSANKVERAPDVPDPPAKPPARKQGGAQPKDPQLVAE